MQILIGTKLIELKHDNADDLPDGQAELYRLLLSLFAKHPSGLTVRMVEIEANSLVEALKLKSFLPVLSRLEHLEKRGYLSLESALVEQTA